MVESFEEDMTEQSKMLRPDLVKMLKKTANHLTRKQKREAHTLLYEYTYLFAKSDSDLGRTDIADTRLIRGQIDLLGYHPEEYPPTLQSKLINIWMTCWKEE